MIDQHPPPSWLPPAGHALFARLWTRRAALGRETGCDALLGSIAKVIVEAVELQRGAQHEPVDATVLANAVRRARHFAVAEGFIPPGRERFAERGPDGCDVDLVKLLAE
jgi:hypothetical protein